MKLSINEQARLCRRIAALLGTGMGIAEAFTFVARSFDGKKMKLINTIIDSISQGRSCSETLSLSSVFDRALVHMITIGEKSGSLGTAFAQAAQLLEKRQVISRKIYGALIYPGFIACATIGISLFLVVYIFPKIIPLVTSMGIPLPFLTRVLIIVSNLLRKDWLLLIVLSCALFFLLLILWKFAKFFRRVVGIIFMALPLAGALYRSKIIIQIFKPLGLLIAHGEHIPEALVSVSVLLANDEYIEVLKTTSIQVTRGQPLAECILNQGHLFPRLVADFLETGERTGGIASACEHIAELYEADVDESIKHVSTVIEPVLMLVMGAIVGGIALSIVMPIYEVTSYLSK